MSAHSEPAWEGPIQRLARGAWQAVLGAGAAALVLGALVLLWPGVTIGVAAVVFGIYLVLSGIAQIAAAFGAFASGPMRVMSFISGALSLMLGVLCFRDSLMNSVLLLTLWIGIGWLFRGITQTVAAASDPAMQARGWQVFLGIITGLAGVVFLVSPFSSIVVLTVAGGCWLLALGVVEIVAAFRLRRQAKRLPGQAQTHSG
ncbi:HdeD family acid-resistance protein [Amycolatopsis sp. NPDC058986]|uniref:HdeD family acid-resistance protein n=1 Tax=unclassified Amycolatopsis TaxID=2618356 RepID=UPI0036732784